MPLQSKRSRSAKHKWQNAHAGFTKGVSSPPSPKGSVTSVYCVSDDSSDTSMISEEGSDDGEQGYGVGASVEALQHLYAMFLPPHLRLEAHPPEKLREITKQRVVYTGDSRTMRWRKKVALGHAAKECTTLDGFITRKVCS